MLSWAEHPLASVTITEYSPSLNPVAVCVVWPLLQRYVNGAVPVFSVWFMRMVPSLLSKQERSVFSRVITGEEFI
ncbi:hypothetical protein [Antarcticibacterium flavum]|uniref:hypothetical protein n=1 Tax=Antarcticibacterium flavum TaxID=2058175 RepID=UPI001FECA2A6|nr:hypothetical protein [Antarcticibacterium flavum]